jgi:hypothetical protein
MFVDLENRVDGDRRRERLFDTARPSDKSRVDVNT